MATSPLLHPAPWPSIDLLPVTNLAYRTRIIKKLPVTNVFILFVSNTYGDEISLISKRERETIQHKIMPRMRPRLKQTTRFGEMNMY